MTAYYNENDAYAAEWLRRLIAVGHIAPGDVDERSIEDVRPDDLRGYTQCHFFAGIGGWSHALDLAGWPRDQPVWTGSCPCQPFSQAGEGAGFDDQRHLWPAWFHLIRECAPAIVFGEQVASKAAQPWIDLVHADLEGVGYAFGCVPFPAAGIGAPHIRDRNYWMAHPICTRLEGFAGHGDDCDQPGRHDPQPYGPVATAGADDRLAHTADQRLDGRRSSEARDGRNAPRIEPQRLRNACGMSETTRSGRRKERADGGRIHARVPAQGNAARLDDGGSDHRPGPTNGFWGAADWLLCRDGKWRPVEPGTQPLAYGIPARVGRLRAYGNAICAPQAAEFIRGCCEASGVMQGDMEAVA